MRVFIAATFATAALAAVPATAQYHSSRSTREVHHDLRAARRDYHEAVRNAGSQHDVNVARRDYRQDVRSARQDYHQDARYQPTRYVGGNNWQNYRNYDWNHREPGYSHYYADRYYRDGAYYQPHRLTRYDRIYRGRDNRYYCRRSDGTTGLIIGGISGGVIGNQIAGGDSRTLGTLLGGAAGALLGQSIDRGQVICR